MSRAHRSVIPPQNGEVPDPLPRHATEVLSTAATTDLADLVGELHTMDEGIRPLGRADRFVGSALTVRAPSGDNWPIYGALSLAGPGHVLVVDWRGYRTGCGGGALALETPGHRGLQAVVIDGAWRDLDDIGMPVFGRSTTLHSPAKSARGDINVPAACGNVVVHPGDAVVGGPDGVVVVPRAHLAEVVDAVERRHDTSTPAAVSRIAADYWKEEDKDD